MGLRLFDDDVVVWEDTNRRLAFQASLVLCRVDKIAILKIEDAMTVTLKLKPEVEAGLLTQAQASGMTLEEYLLSMVEGAVLLKAQESSSAEERAAAFEAWSAGHRPTPLLSDYAVSREAMYEGRDD
jgi:hypothetical protein